MTEEITQPVIVAKNGKIEFANVDQFKRDFEQLISRNSNFIVVPETLTGSKKARAELRKAAKTSADWRSRVKNELLKPFDEIADIATGYEKQAKDAAIKIDDDVKVFDEAERQKRLDGLKQYINARAEELDIDTISEIPDKHLIKGNFNGTVPKKKFIDDVIEPELKRLVSEKEHKLSNTQAVKNYAESKGFDPEPYINQLEFETLAQIMGNIDGDVLRKQKREESERAMAALKKQQVIDRQKTVNEKTIDEDTGEVIQPVEKPKVIERLLYVTGTIDELKAVAEFMDNNNIQYRGAK